MLFHSRLLDLNFSPGSESLEVALFREEEIPWNEIAFPVIRETLKLFFSDLTKGELPLRGGTITRVSDNPRRYEINLL